MAEYASKGVAGTGLGLGIAGTALALLQNNQGGTGGILGNLLGNNNNYMELMQENTLLKAQQYTDNSNMGIKIDLAKQEERMNCMNTKMELKDQIIDGKMALVAQTANAGISQLQCQLQCLQNTVAGISSTYVPAGKVTPLPAPNPFPPVPPYGPYPPFYPFVPPFAPPPPPPGVVIVPPTNTDPGTATNTSNSGGTNTGG